MLVVGKTVEDTKAWRELLDGSIPLMTGLRSTLLQSLSLSLTVCVYVFVVLLAKFACLHIDVSSFSILYIVVIGDSDGAGETAVRTRHTRSHTAQKSAFELAVEMQRGGRTDDLSSEDRLLEMIRTMQDGAYLLKYPRKGAPDFRFFQLKFTSDVCRLDWISKKKQKEGEAGVDLFNVEGIYAGQKSEIFLRHRDRTLENVSFSIDCRERFSFFSSCSSLCLSISRSYPYGSLS